MITLLLWQVGQRNEKGRANSTALNSMVHLLILTRKGMNMHPQCMAFIQPLTSKNQGLRLLKFPMAAERGLELKVRSGFSQLTPAVRLTQRPSDLVLSHTVLAHATFSGKGELWGNCTCISHPQYKNVSQERTQKQT